MNAHYYELQQYLQKITETPRLILDPTFLVFTSEHQLYEQTSQLNHRCKLAYTHIHSRLHQLDEFDERLTFPLVQAAAAHMLKKITSYKADQLPGGSLWEPTGRTKEIASKMVPTNDKCESALGLNDWLQRGTVNMTQRTTSSMVEVLKNKTVPWLVGLPEQQKGPIINLARKRAATVIKEDKDVSEEHYRQRKEARLEAMQKGAMKVAREQDRQNELSKIRRISTPAELREIIEQTGAFKDKRNETEAITIIKQQMALRRNDYS